MIASVVLAGALLAGCGSSSGEGAQSVTAGSAGAAASEAVTAAESAVRTGSGADGSIKVGMAIKNMKGPYFVKLIDSLKSECEKRGWSFSYLSADDDSTKEAANMESFITQGVDVLFLDSVDPDACIPSIDTAAEAGIPVINLDSDVNGGNYVTTVYSNNDENGRLVGNAYIDWLKAHDKDGKEIKAILLSGAKGNVAGMVRRDGLIAGIIQGRTGCTDEEAFKAAEDMEEQLKDSGTAENKDADFQIVGQGWGNWVIEEGMTAAEDFLTANPDVTVMLGENDQMLIGALTALENAGMTGVDLLAAADGAQDACDLIRENEDADNPYVSTGLNSPVLVAQTGMEVAEQIVIDGASWDSFEKITKTEAVAITNDNVDQYYDLGF